MIDLLANDWFKVCLTVLYIHHYEHNDPLKHSARCYTVCLNTEGILRLGSSGKALRPFRFEFRLRYRLFRLTIS
jgi:hypothetical protein